MSFKKCFLLAGKIWRNMTSEINKAIKDIDEPLFNRIRAKCGGSEFEMEHTILTVLNNWVNNG